MLERMYQTLPFSPINKLVFYYNYLGLDWLFIPFVFTLMQFWLFGMSLSSHGFKSSYHTHLADTELDAGRC